MSFSSFCGLALGLGVADVMFRKQARGFLLEAPSWSRACVSLLQARTVMLDLAARSR